MLYDPKCPFCIKIRDGEDEYGFVHNTTVPEVVCFDPIGPVTEGHMLFVPIVHCAVASDSPVFVAASVHAAIDYATHNGIRSYNLIQSNRHAATQTVDHVHVHLVPRHEGDGLKLPWSAS